MTFENLDYNDPATAKIIGDFLNKTFPGFASLLILSKMDTVDGKRELREPMVITDMHPMDMQGFFEFMAGQYRDGKPQTVRYQ